MAQHLQTVTITRIVHLPYGFHSQAYDHTNMSLIARLTSEGISQGWTSKVRLQRYTGMAYGSRRREPCPV
jgi:hypothetical protein